MAAIIISKTTLDLSIPLDLNNTLKDTTGPGAAILEKIYTNAMQKYGQPITYQLHQKPDDGTCFLQNWHGRDQLSPPLFKPFTNKKLPFVIQADANGKRILRIGNGKHYYAANKAKSVFAAGDIVFLDDSTVDYFDDRSGAYIVPQNNVYMQRKIATLKTMIEMGLPMEKFRFYMPTPHEQKCLFQALYETGTPEEKALRMVLISSRMDIKEIEKAITLGSVTIKSIKDIPDLPILKPVLVPAATATSGAAALTPTTHFSGNAVNRKISTESLVIDADTTTLGSHSLDSQNLVASPMPMVLPNATAAFTETVMVAAAPSQPLSSSQPEIQDINKPLVYSIRAPAPVITQATIPTLEQPLTPVGVSDPVLNQTKTVTASNGDNSTGGCCECNIM